MKTLAKITGFLMLSQAASGVTVLFEDFEDSTIGYTASIVDPGASDGSEDFFGRVGLTGIAISNAIAFSNIQGAGFFAGSDMDASGAGDPNLAGGIGVVEWTGLNITGLENLSFSGFFAEDDDGANEDWDSTDFLIVEVQIDGGGYTKVFGIENDGSTFNTAPLVDTDLDGTGDGAEITDAFTNYSAAISGTGGLLDVRITLDLDSGDEDVAFDNVMVTGDLVPEPSSVAFLSLGMLALLRRRR